MDTLFVQALFGFAFTLAVFGPCSVVRGEQTATQLGTPSQVDGGTAVACPATMPNGSTPPGEQPVPGHHGNGELWTQLWPEGTVEIRPENVHADGALAIKWPWWRAVPGQLVITGQRLDAKAPPAWAETPGGRRLDPATPTPGIRYGESPPGFQAVEMIFPTVGCWEVTAHAGDASLTFVTRVVRVER